MSTLGIFAKQPVPGMVKTRLGAEIGHDAAAALYAAFQRDLLFRTRETAERRVLAWAPLGADAEAYFRGVTFPGDILWPQPEGMLGERLLRFFQEFLLRGPVVVIGTDSPTLPVELIKQALESLQNVDAVLGPATDGGYYLIGQSKPVPQLFTNIDWSSPDVLRQTIERLRSAGGSFELLAPWYDVDTLADVKFLRGHINGLRHSGSQHDIPEETERKLAEILHDRS